MAAPIGNDYAVGNPGGGRPSEYKPEYADMAYKIALLGATDVELGEIFDVSEQTINNWKNAHEDFYLALKKGKKEADAEISNSLYERAKGCSITVQQAIKLTTKTPDENGKISQTEHIEVVDLVQEVPPDTTAAIFWLKNRRPQHWRDKQEIDHKGYLANLNTTPLSPEEVKDISKHLDAEY